MSSGETILYLVRHGRLVNSHQGVLNGKSDVPLSRKGMAEVMAWADIFPKGTFSLVLSSDLSRTAIPGSKYGRKLGCGHRCLKELREVDAGRWEGMSMIEILESDGEYFRKRLRAPVSTPFPGGESLGALRTRVMGAMSGILREYRGSRLLMVSHSGVIRVLMQSLLGIPLRNFFKFEIDFGSLTIIRIFDDGNATLKLFNRSPGGIHGAGPH